MCTLQLWLLSSLFPEIQRGFHRGSVERAVHSINAHLELTEHLLKEKSAGIFVDFAAAIQTLDRSMIASSFFSVSSVRMGLLQAIRATAIR
jgi:16S rRNA G527 N7-methylase RsmG